MPKQKDVTLLSEDEKERISILFRKLDVDKNGRVSINELKQLIKGNSNMKDENAQQIFAKGKKSVSKFGDDDTLSLHEFISYVRDTETHLKLAFKQLDKNSDNKVDPSEIKQAMSDLGVEVSLEQAKQLMKQMDKDGSLSIDYEEWRDFLLLSGNTDLKNIFRYLRRSYVCDIGDNSLLWDDFTDEEKISGEAFKTLLAGGLAGCVSRTSTAPLDRIKTIWMARGVKAASGGLFNSFRIMISEGGISSLWRGNGVNCIKIAPETAVKFQAYEHLKKVLINRPNRNTLSKDVTLGEKFVAGGFAGAISQTIIYPMEVVKTRMCLRSTGEYFSTFDCARKLYKEYGLRVFFRGYIPNALGILPYAGIDLSLFETFKSNYAKSMGDTVKDAPPTYISLGAGAFSSVIAQLVTYPLALVRTKMQAQKDKSSDNFLTILKNIKRNEGFSGLYRGIGPNMLKVIPAVSISYACYDHLRVAMGISNTKK